MQTTQETFVGQRSFSNFKEWSDAARYAGWLHWIGDIPVHKDLLPFFKAFKDKRYNVVPCIDTSPVSIQFTARNGDSQWVRVYNQLGITFPDATEYRSGVIGIAIGDNRKNKSDAYFVQSESIANEKFSSSSPGYTMQQSKDMKKALKVALRVLTPLDADDVQSRSTSGLHGGLNTLRHNAKSKLHGGLELTRDEIMQEVSHMIASGYAPCTDIFRKAIDLIAKEGAELKRMQDYKPRACFVWVKSNSLMYRFVDTKEFTECTSMDDVPELIRNKLAVLQIAKDGDAIADIGVRVSASTYWVFA
jgi:hypothetical protein